MENSFKKSLSYQLALREKVLRLKLVPICLALLIKINAFLVKLPTAYFYLS